MLTGLGALILALAATGCQSSDGTDEGHVTGAGSKLQQAGSATVQFDVSLSNEVGHDSVRWIGVSRSAYGERPATEIDFTDVSVHAAAANAPTRKIELHEIIVGGTRYHRSPQLQTPPNTPWVRLDEGSFVHYGLEIANADLGVLDPMAYLGLVRSLSPGQELASRTDRTESIDGAMIRLYQVECDLGAACSATAMPLPFIELFPGPNTMVLKLWLDEQQRPRKIEATVDLDTGETGIDGGKIVYKLRTTLAINDLGAAVTVAEPRPDETTTNYTIRP
jgi:hypothetical protein